jgi:uncharacterized protein YuzE
MDTDMTKMLYELFLKGLSERPAEINYDPEFDILYIAGEQRWSPEIGEKPRTFTVASGIQIDVLRSNHQVFGVEIADFDNELHAHGNGELVAWWIDVKRMGITTVDGRRLTEALQHASFV